MDLDSVVQLFRTNSSEKLRQFNDKIINSGVPSIGCTVPFVRSVAKRFAHQPDEVAALPVHAYYEVDLFKGMVVVLQKLPFERKRRLLDDFAATIENWAVCDCNTVKVPAAESQLYFEYFRQLCKSSQPFVCRYGVVNLISFLDSAHVQGIFGALEGIVCWGHYYVDMAVAWLVATAMACCREETVQFVEGMGRQILTPFAYNKALQKMRDSYRISPQDKQWTKTLKLL